MDGWITTVVNELIDGFIDNPDGKADLFRDLCAKLPLFIINDALGLPRDKAEMQAAGAGATVRLSGAYMETPESLIELHKAQIALIKLFQPYIDEYRIRPAENLFSHIVNAKAEGEKSLTDADRT